MAERSLSPSRLEALAHAPPRDDERRGPSSEPSLRELLRWLLGITRPVHPPLLVSLFFRVVNLSLDVALFATAAGGAVQLATGGTETARFFAALVALSLGKALAAYLEQFTGHYVAFKALELLRTFVFAKLWPKAPAIVAFSRSGDLLASLTRDVDRIEVVYAHTFAPVVSAHIVAPLAFALAAALFGLSHVWIAGAALGLSLFVVPYIGVRRAFADTAETLARRRALAQHVTDSVFGLDEVLGYGREAERLEAMDALGQAIQASASAPRRIAALRRGANVLLALVAVASVVWLGLGEQPLYVLAALAAGTLRVFEAPRGVEDSTGYLDHSLSAARRLYAISHAPDRVSDGPDTLALSRPPSVRFEGVSYAYPSPDGRALDDALSDVSLEIPAGGHAILVGRSGSGKSTLVQLLLRYDDPRRGRVALDGAPITRFSLDSLRRNVVAVSQRNQLLAASIAENLRLGAPRASDEELRRAIEVVGLAREIDAMPEGLGTFVGPNGAALSGGQAQRLCLARALLVHPKVLVLDEFAAHLDEALEDEIREALSRWDADMTILEVTHRLRASRHADLVAVLDRGRLLLAGPPSEVTEEAIAARFASSGGSSR